MDDHSSLQTVGETEAELSADQRGALKRYLDDLVALMTARLAEDADGGAVDRRAPKQPT